ncbi:MAG: hypothetical protein NZM94_15920, partial [Roseiflexus sp.]|nr:hypothetical protein [Roseiflexus sp.]
MTGHLGAPAASGCASGVWARQRRAPTGIPCSARAPDRVPGRASGVWARQRRAPTGILCSARAPDRVPGRASSVWARQRRAPTGVLPPVTFSPQRLSPLACGRQLYSMFLILDHLRPRLVQLVLVLEAGTRQSMV